MKHNPTSLENSDGMEDKGVHFPEGNGLNSV